MLYDYLRNHGFILQDKGRQLFHRGDIIPSVDKDGLFLNPNKIIPIHYKGWTHFKGTEATLKKAITTSELTKDRTTFLKSVKSPIAQQYGVARQCHVCAHLPSIGQNRKPAAAWPFRS